jgi:predicted dehydrogenase
MKLKNYKNPEYQKYNIPNIGIGIMGYGFMGKAHSNAYKQIGYMSWPPPAIPKLIAICGRNETRVSEAAIRYSYEGYYTEWKRLAIDPRIQIFDNVSPDKWHCDPTIMAAKEGKNVFCEKPLALSVKEAKHMLDAVRLSQVKNMVGFNYRFLPAVRLAKDLIDEGKLGDIYQFTGKYFQPFGSDPSETVENIWYAQFGHPGVLFGIGSHIIDIARFLVGEIESVKGIKKNFNKKRKDIKGIEHNINIDEANSAIFNFKNGALGSIEVSCLAAGRMNHKFWEINGSKGSIYFDLEDLNHLYFATNKPSDERISGFIKILVANPCHPFSSIFYPQPGIALGWDDSFIAELYHFIDCIVNKKSVEPYGATFKDGYINLLILEAINKSSITGKEIKINSNL